jgi:hypothetical protein
MVHMESPWVSPSTDTVAAGCGCPFEGHKQGQSQLSCRAVGAGCDTEEGVRGVVRNDTTASSFGWAEHVL